MPFLFTDAAQAFKLLDGPLGKELGDKSAAKNLVVLGYWDNGIRQVSNSKRAVLAPADMKGLKIRTPPDAVTIDIMTTRRGDTTDQVRRAVCRLQQGLSTGGELLANIEASKLHEVQKFIPLTGHKFEMTPFLMSKRTWDRLEADRDHHGSGHEATAVQRKQDADEKLVGDLKGKGVRIDKVDTAPFAKPLKRSCEVASGPIAIRQARGSVGARQVGERSEVRDKRCPRLQRRDKHHVERSRATRTGHQAGRARHSVA
jgi:TRAP-type C4-dicarboxylate transport system substrate-binding protein